MEDSEDSDGTILTVCFREGDTGPVADVADDDDMDEWEALPEFHMDRDNWADGLDFGSEEFEEFLRGWCVEHPGYETGP